MNVEKKWRLFLQENLATYENELRRLLEPHTFEVASERDAADACGYLQFLRIMVGQQKSMLDRISKQPTARSWRPRRAIKRR